MNECPSPALPPMAGYSRPSPLPPPARTASGTSRVGPTFQSFAACSTSTGTRVCRAPASRRSRSGAFHPQFIAAGANATAARSVESSSAAISVRMPP